LTPDLAFESQFDGKTGQIMLKHKNVTSKHAGELICRVENVAGNIEVPVNLDVQSRLLFIGQTFIFKLNSNLFRLFLAGPILTKKLIDQDVMIDNEIRFVVDVTGSPKPIISWSKDDTSSITIDTDHTFESDGTTHTLVIKNVKSTDEGKYRMVASNELGQVESTGQLTVLEQPIVEQTFGDVTQSAGSDVSLKCRLIGGRPKPIVTWLKNGKEFKSDDRHIVVSSADDDTHELLIKSLDETENQAKYTFVAKNKVGQKDIHSTITVKAQLEFVQPLIDQDVLAQSACTLTVETNGIPKPTVKW
jgi:hypothetical protein